MTDLRALRRQWFKQELRASLPAWLAIAVVLAICGWWKWSLTVDDLDTACAGLNALTEDFSTDPGGPYWREMEQACR